MHPFQSQILHGMYSADGTVRQPGIKGQIYHVAARGDTPEAAKASQGVTPLQKDALLIIVPDCSSAARSNGA
ncbi:hypothetical protein PROAA_290052 [Candidatus Propionivibrio aalborgensis]|uniref:Uncharacterized protein n=1 Tax=Candidatus Propionivibrio aalborgensis TaxID=1860101 RepID=A0A1A8XVY9_9RHOO|nr:hypothetical protein PROAA_290052 [Candidatus Propionivibrio aalborgensis]